MSDEEGQPTTELREDVAQLWTAARAIVKRLPSARKALDRLTGGLLGEGGKALAARLHRYRTENIVTEAQQVANASGMPLPAVLESLVRQRRIDELSMEALALVGEDASNTSGATEGGGEDTTDRWFQTFYREAGMADENDVRQAFVRILAGEIQTPGSFSLQTLRIVGSMNRSTARNFRRAASASIRASIDGKHILDARVPAIGGALGQNCLKEDGLSYEVLQGLMEHGLLLTDLNSYWPYGVRFKFPVNEVVRSYQIPAVHQNEKWLLAPKDDSKKAEGIRVEGVSFTSSGRELFRIVDIEPLPEFRNKLVAHLSDLGLQVRPAT